MHSLFATRALLLGACVALSVALPAPLPVAAAVNALEVVASQPVAPGVSHSRVTASAANGHVTANVVKADLSTQGIGMVATAALDRVNARELPTLQAARMSRDGHRVVTTINGSTFASWPNATAAARGLNVSNGELITAGHPRAGERLISFAVDGAGRPMIGAPRLALTVTLPDGSDLDLARVNQPRLAGEAVLFTPRYDISTLTDDTGVEVLVAVPNLPITPHGSWSGTIREVRVGAGNAPIGADEVVISAVGEPAAALAALEPESELVIELSIDAGWREVVQAVGGREWLMRDGEVDIFPTGGTTYSTSEPRSALGITPAGKVLMVVVDGRQSHSRGLTIPEMAQLMRDLGAVDAINLDGGGSSVMSVRSPGMVEAAIANTPSTSGVERTVANALHVVSTIPTGDLDEVVAMPASARLQVGETLAMRLGGHDASFNGVDPGLGPPSWSASEGIVEIDQDGLLTALAAGQVTVTGQAGGRSASSSITVLGSPGPTVPTGLTATAHDNFVIKLSWQASTSSVGGLIHYRVFRNGTAIGTQQTALNYTDQRSKANAFSYQVRAIDSAGNKSELSAPVVISSVASSGGATPTPTPTPAPTPTPTSTPAGPTVPQGLAATAHPNFVIKLAWQPSTSSAAGTMRYRVFRNGKAIGVKQTGTTFTDQRKKVNTFHYQVRAIDRAGRKSALSPVVTIVSRR